MSEQLAATKKASVKSKLQARYEELLEDIEHTKAAQKNLEDGLRAIMPRIMKEIRPLLSQRDALIRQRLLRLDELADELGPGKYDRVWLDAYLSEQAGHVFDRSGSVDNAFADLVRKYVGEIKMLGEAVAESGKNFDPLIKKQANKQQEALKQDARAIYLRLVKKYHPDRELNEADKGWKTELVQRVAQAHQENDFLTLLKLQIEYLEEEETDARFLAEDMLRRYSKILQRQLDDIKDEVDYLRAGSMGVLEEFFNWNDTFSERKFRNFKKSVRAQSAAIQADLNNSKTYAETWFKEWVKAIKAYQ